MTQKQHLQLCISLAVCGYLEAFTALFYNCLGLCPSVECKLLRAIFKPFCSDYPKNVWMWGSMDKIPSKSKRQEPPSSLIALKRKVWPLVWLLRNQFWSLPIRRPLCRMYCLWKEAWSQACHYNWEFGVRPAIIFENLLVCSRNILSTNHWTNIFSQNLRYEKNKPKKFLSIL